MYYLQSRYYNPEWGRFINADGIVGETGDLLGHNMFTYCKNNPVNGSDPDGYKALIGTEEDSVGLGILIGIVTVVTAAIRTVNNAISNTFHGIGQSLTKSSIPSMSNYTTLTSEADIPMTARKSGSYYPAVVLPHSDTIAVNFSTPLNQGGATYRAVKQLGDVYTFIDGNAYNLAKSTGTSNPKRDNHKYDQNGNLKPGLYWDHYHGPVKYVEPISNKEFRVHLFYGLPR